MNNWKKGRGKLGLFNPILGNWVCNPGSKDRTNPQCIREIRLDLDNKYLIQDVTWHLGDKLYTDHTIIGMDNRKRICFWSFTSDGKNSTGVLADVSDIHPNAFGFEAEMPAGLARQAFWPDDELGFHWAVESKNKKGWKRFVHQHFKPNEK